MNRKVLFLSYYFSPFSSALSQRSGKLTKYLPANGWDPLVVTVGNDPLRHQDPNLEEDVKDIRRVLTEKSVLPSWVTQNNFVRLALNRVLIPDIEIGWLPILRRTNDDLIRKEEISLVYTSCAPFSLNYEGRRIKKTFGIPWVTDFRDPWTIALGFTPLTPVHRWLTKRLEERVCDHCDYFISNTPTALKAQLQAFPHLQGKSTCISNGFDPVDFSEEKIPAFQEQNPNSWHLLFTGTWYRKYYSNILFQIIAAFRTEHPAVLLQLHYSGPHFHEFAKSVHPYGLTPTLVNHGYQSHLDVLKTMRQVNVLLMTQPMDDRARYWVPAKTYECLASGIPILATCPAGDAADLVKKHGVHVNIEEADCAMKGKAALTQLWEHDSRRTSAPQHDPALKSYQYPELAAHLADVFNKVCRTHQ